MNESADRASMPTEDHLKEAYAMFRREIQPDYLGLGMTDPVWSLAADWVDSNDVDPYEYIRAQFMRCEHGVPFIRSLASDRAKDNYFEIIGSSKSFQLGKFAVQVTKLLAYVQVVGASVDQVLLYDPEFMAIVRVVLCTDEALPEIEERFLGQAIKEIRNDRELKKYIKDNYDDRSKRLLRESIPIKLTGPLVEVGPVQKSNRKGFLTANRPRHP